MKTTIFDKESSHAEKLISNRMECIWEYAQDDNATAWTKGVNEILNELAKVRSICPETTLLTASKSSESNNQEWLWDFVWYTNNEQKSLNHIELIVESEWINTFDKTGYEESLQYDFEKLIAGRAVHRLMIFEALNETDCARYVATLKSIVLNSRISKLGDRYMFAGWIRGREFMFDLLIVGETT